MIANTDMDKLYSAMGIVLKDILILTWWKEKVYGQPAKAKKFGEFGRTIF